VQRVDRVDLYLPRVKTYEIDWPVPQGGIRLVRHMSQPG
jgi:hypothetical protein